MSAEGTDDPAAIPVRRCWKPVRGMVPFRRRESSALNIVGTPNRSCVSSPMDRRKQEAEGNS